MLTPRLFRFRRPGVPTRESRSEVYSARVTRETRVNITIPDAIVRGGRSHTTREISPDCARDRTRPCRSVCSQQVAACRRGGAAMPGTLEMSSERRRNEPVLGAVKITEVSTASARARARVLRAADFRSDRPRAFALVPMSATKTASRYVATL